MQRFLQLVLVLWAGSLWTLCGIVAPSLFAVLADRHVAGQLAGHFFSVATWLGLACGSVVLLLMTRGAIAWRTRLDYGLVLTAMFAPLLSELGLRSVMNTARSAGNTQLFGLLHGAGALLFAVACLALLVVVWRFSAPSQGKKAE